MSKAPYVVTNDLNLVLDTLESLGISMPSKSAVSDAADMVLSSLKSIFSNVESIEAGRILGFLKDQTSKSSIPVVSLTSLLEEPDAIASLEFSRSVKVIGRSNGIISLEDAGLMPRYNKGSYLQQQFSSVSGKIKSLGAVTEIALADDVVFSGGTIRKIIEGFKAQGISVKKVFASVALNDAVESLGKDNIEVIADCTYRSVIDEICMRDFIVAAPGGGRNIILENGTYASAPYLRPFGQIEKWASLEGDAAEKHSKACLEASRLLWDGIINARGEKVRFGDLRKPVLLCDNKESVTEKIDNLLKNKAYNANYTHSL